MSCLSLLTSRFLFHGPSGDHSIPIALTALRILRKWEKNMWNIIFQSMNRLIFSFLSIGNWFAAETSVAHWEYYLLDLWSIDQLEKDIYHPIDCIWSIIELNAARLSKICWECSFCPSWLALDTRHPRLEGPGPVPRWLPRRLSSLPSSSRQWPPTFLPMSPTLPSHLPCRHQPRHQTVLATIPAIPSALPSPAGLKLHWPALMAGLSPAIMMVFPGDSSRPAEPIVLAAIASAPLSKLLATIYILHGLDYDWWASRFENFFIINGKLYLFWRSWLHAWAQIDFIIRTWML